MDCLVLGEVDLEVDVEGGGTDGGHERAANLDSVNGKAEKLLNRVWSGHSNSDGSEKIEDGLSCPLTGEKNPGEKSTQNLDPLEKKSEDVKFKKNSRKPPKPPRPPKGPSLSANDQKLMREVAELAMRKRARIERMKTLRKMKAAKSSSPCSSIFAMIVTILFFLILVFQGLFSKSSASLRSDGSPAPAVSANDRLISVQFYNDFAPRERNDPSPTTSFRYAEKRVSGADNEENVRDVTR